MILYASYRVLEITKATVGRMLMTLARNINQAVLLKRAPKQSL